MTPLLVPAYKLCQDDEFCLKELTISRTYSVKPKVLNIFILQEN